MGEPGLDGHAEHATGWSVDDPRPADVPPLGSGRAVRAAADSVVPTTSPPPVAGDARSGRPSITCVSTTWSRRCSSARASTSRSRSSRCRVWCSTRATSLRRGGRDARRPRRAQRHPLRRAGAQGRRRQRSVRPATASCSSRCDDLRSDLGDDVVVMADLCVDEYTDHGHCGVLDDRGDRRQRRHARDLRPGRGGAGDGRCAGRGAERHDGRPGRGDPSSARRRRFRRRRDHGVLGEVRERPVRPVPRCRRRVDRRWWRPQGLPAGLAQCPRGAARDRPRSRRGCRHRDGEAGAGVPRRHRRRPRAVSTCRSRRIT